MSEIVLKDASVVVNSVDLSDHISSVTINYSAEITDKTAFGATARSRIAGLKDFSVDLEFNQDYASSNVDATLFPLVGAAAFAIVIKPTSGSVSATNPSFTGNVLVETYSPLAGAVGELNKTSVSLPGDGDMTRATS